MKANIIRAKIREKELTQEEVAKRIGISENSMSRKLNGKRDFSLREVAALCTLLDIRNAADVFF